MLVLVILLTTLILVVVFTTSVSLRSIGTDLIPSEDNVFRIGTSAKRWKSLSVGEGTIFITDATTNQEVALTIDNGIFFIDGIAQAQLENVNVVNLTFGNGLTPQTVPYIPPAPVSFQPLFNTISPTSLAGVTSTGSYTLISPKMCYIRVFVNFATCTDFGGAVQYKITLPFPSKATIREGQGLLHQTAGASLYHIAGIVDIVDSTTIMKLYYFASQTDLAWKSSTPVGGTTVNSHFDISFVYEIDV
jgi:hypothetical protein